MFATRTWDLLKVIVSAGSNKKNYFNCSNTDDSLSAPFIPAGIYLLQVNNRNTKRRCKICSKVTLKIPEQHPRRRSGVFVVNFKNISHLVLLFLLLTLNMELPPGITTQLSAAKPHKPLLLGKYYFVFNHLFHKKKVFIKTSKLSWSS